MKKSPVSFSRRAFSLIELIVVVAIIAIIAAFTVPQAGQILKGSTLTQGSQILTDQIRLGREYALTKNSKVEVRFYQYADPEAPGEVVTTPSTGQFRAIQIFRVINVTQGTGENTIYGERTLPLDKVQMLPQSIVMLVTNPDGATPNPAASTLLPPPNSGSSIYPIVSTPGSQEPSGLLLPRGIGNNYNYVTFRFLQDGSTNLSPTGNVWFMTLINLTDKGYMGQGSANMPFNYFSLQIDPVIGTTKAYRPQAG